MIKYIPIIFILSGCALFGPKPIVIDREINLPGFATELCNDLEKISSIPSMEEVLLVTVKNAEIYYDCKLKNKMKADLIKKITTKE